MNSKTWFWCMKNSMACARESPWSFQVCVWLRICLVTGKWLKGPLVVCLFSFLRRRLQALPSALKQKGGTVDADSLVKDQAAAADPVGKLALSHIGLGNLWEIIINHLCTCYIQLSVYLQDVYGGFCSWAANDGDALVWGPIISWFSRNCLWKHVLLIKALILQLRRVWSLWSLISTAPNTIATFLQ